jgi:hypothetical protein
MVSDEDAAFVADPFLWKKDSLWYMFFEILNKKDMKGDIGYAYSKDLNNWEYGKVIIDCSYHLSYPYIFEWNDTIYMIPESAEAGFLSLYVAKKFPESWVLKDTLLYGNFGDHAIIHYNNVWWLYAGAEPKKNSRLRLFYSEKLPGEWIEHPASPIVVNKSEEARPAGRIFIYENKIIRLAQNCRKTYGKEVNAFVVEQITKDKYTEIEYTGNPIIQKGKNRWALHGMHQIDAWQINDSFCVAAVDGYNKKLTISIEY